MRTTSTTRAEKAYSSRAAATSHRHQRIEIGDSISMTKSGKLMPQISPRVAIRNLQAPSQPISTDISQTMKVNWRGASISLRRADSTPQIAANVRCLHTSMALYSRVRSFIERAELAILSPCIRLCLFPLHCSLLQIPSTPALLWLYVPASTCKTRALISVRR